MRSHSIVLLTPLPFITQVGITWQGRYGLQKATVLTVLNHIQYLMTLVARILLPCPCFILATAIGIDFPTLAVMQVIRHLTDDLT